MRYILLIAAVAAVPLIASAPAQAQNVGGAWCAGQNLGGDSWTENCSFRSFEACRQEVNAGNRGICFQNPYQMEHRMDRAYGRAHR